MENKNEKKEFVTLEGFIGADAQLVESSNAKKMVANFSVAEGKGQNLKWHNIQLWEDAMKKAAGKDLTKEEILNDFSAKKGDYVKLSGYFKSYEGKNGPGQIFVVSEILDHKAKSNVEKKQVETLVGRLGGDPEINKKDEKEYARFSVALDKKDSEGKTVWKQCVAFSEYIDSAHIREMKKGDIVTLNGQFIENSNPAMEKSFLISGGTIEKKNQSIVEQGKGSVNESINM